MEKFKTLFSRSFSEQALEQLFRVLDKIRLDSSDELFIILNDFKYTLAMSEEDNGDIIYSNNELRQQIINSVNKQCLKDINKSSNEYKVMSEILTITSMFERIEKRLIAKPDEYKPLFDMFGKIRTDTNDTNDTNMFSLQGGTNSSNNSSTYEELFDISYNDNSEIVLTIGSRDLTIITVLLILYVFYDSDSYAFNLYKHINFHYHHGNKLDDTQAFDSIATNPSMKAEEIDQGMSINQILNISYGKFHSLIHLMNKDYNINSLTAQFSIIQVWLLFKSLLVISKFNGTTDYIDVKAVLANDEVNCSLIHNGIEPAFSNILLCSIYSFNLKYDWFDLDRFNSFINAYGQTVNTLSVFIKDREKYNVLYALGLIYALRYTNISLSNKLFKKQINVQINDLSTEWLTSSNRAMLFTVKDPKVAKKLNYFVLEIQDRVLYVSNTLNGQNESNESYNINNQVMNDNRNCLVSFIVYNVMKQSKNNIDYICYDIDDLKKVLNDYKNGIRDPLMIRNNTVDVSIDENIKLMTEEISYNGFILRLIGFIAIIALIVYIIFSNSHKKLIMYEQDKYDKSLY